jgi:hypothetical protein
MQRALNAIQMQGNSDDEDLEEHLPVVQHPVVVEAEEHPAIPPQQSQADMLMNMSGG